MDIRYITDEYAVSAQIAPTDVAELAASGFTTLINNRPDAEIEAEICCDVIRAAAEAAGMTYVANPMINGGLTLDMVDTQKTACEAADGAVFAYCRSGTRSSIVWALGQAGARPTPDILSALAKAGYDQPALGPQIDALANR